MGVNVEIPGAPPWVDIIIVFLVVAGTVLAAYIAHRRGERVGGATQEEVKRLLYMFRLVEEERRQFGEKLGLLESENLKLRSGCISYECPNHSSKQPGSRHETNGLWRKPLKRY